MTNVVGFDIETTTLCGYDEGARVITAATYPAWDVFGGTYAFYHPDLEGWEKNGEENFEEDESVFDFVHVFGSPEYVDTVVGHNVFFDGAYWEGRMPGRLTAPLFDTMAAHAFIDETAPNALGDVAQKYLGYGKVEGLDRRKLLEYPLEQVLEYNLQDAKLAYELYEPLLHDLTKLNLLGTFNLRMQALRVLIDMHHAGVGVDLAEAEKQVALAGGKLRYVAREIAAICGGDLNLNSPTQLRQVLYDEMKLPVLAHTATGEPSTDRATLDKLKLSASGVAQRLISLIVSHRELSKLRGTYLEPLTSHLGRDGRVHPSYHIAKGSDAGRGGGARYKSFGTVTGRLSSSNPNFQNVAKDERVRRCFVPREGWRLLDADYAQIEVRVAAWLSGDPALLTMVKEGRDYHTHTLSLIEDRDYNDVKALVKSSAMWATKRDTVKRVNFGILYGAYPPKIKEQIEATGVAVSLNEVWRMWQGWKETYATYVAWEALVQQEALEHGEVVSPLGGRRRFPDGVDRSKASRQASNFLIQGTAADIALMGLVDLSRRLKGSDAVILIASVHDSVTLEYAPALVGEDELRRLVRAALVEFPMTELAKIEGIQRLEDLRLEVDVQLNKERWLK